MKRTLMTRALAVLVLFASVSLVAQEPKSEPSREVEQLRAQLAHAMDELAVARAQRADCETQLGPVEAKLRSDESQQRWAALKADMEKARPGVECDPRTGACTKKPEPPKEPERKKDAPPK
jgi:septal ring factor EnvC (AmiA/AmiB activator)